MREETALRADPRLAQLRQHLAAARAQGQDFSEAWAAGQQLVLTGLRRHERHDWRLVLHGTREAWARAYEGQPSSRVDCAVAELEGYTTDCEDGHLHPLAWSSRASSTIGCSVIDAAELRRVLAPASGQPRHFASWGVQTHGRARTAKARAVAGLLVAGADEPGPTGWTQRRISVCGSGGGAWPLSQGRTEQDTSSACSQVRRCCSPASQVRGSATSSAAPRMAARISSIRRSRRSQA